MKTENKEPAKKGRKRKIISANWDIVKDKNISSAELIKKASEPDAKPVKPRRKFYDKPIKQVKEIKPKPAVKVKFKPDEEIKPKQSVVIGSVLAPAVNSDALISISPRIASIGSRNATESDAEREFANAIEPDESEIESVNTLIADNIDSFDNKTPFSKSNRYTITKRVETLIKDLCKGLPTFELVEKYTKLWNISDRTFFLYKLKAQKKLDKHAEYVASTELGKSIKRLENLYNTAYEFGDLKNALAIQKEINELLGLKKPTKIINENTVETVVKFIDDDIEIVVPDDDE